MQYQYYADGRLRFSNESHSGPGPYAYASLFARSYTYDFAGRLDLATTGAEANGQVEPDYNKRPYRQTYTYDTFNHMTGGDRWYWTNYENTFPTKIYQNNRLVRIPAPGGGTYNAEMYDANGRMIGIDAPNAQYPQAWQNRYKYDAGGRLVFYSDYYGRPLSGNTLWVDGAGLVVKSKATEYDCSETNSTCERTTYFIRSTVLDGEIINEITRTLTPGVPGLYPDQTKDEKKTNIFAGDEKIAKHVVVTDSASPLSLNHETTYLVNKDPSGVNFDEKILRGSGPIYGGGNPADRINHYLQLDPFGAITGARNPYQQIQPAPPPYAGPEPDDCGASDGDDPVNGADYDDEGYGNPVAKTCYINGFDHPCREVFDFLKKSGDVKTTREREFDVSPSDSGPQTIWKPEYGTKSLGDVSNDIAPNGTPNQVIAVVNVASVDEGYFVWGDSDWDTASPQNPVVVPLTEQQKATVKDDLAGVLKNKECKDVVEALIAQAEKNTGFKAFSHNLMDTFGKVTSFGNDGIANASAGNNAGSPGGITLRVNYPLSNDDPLIRNLNGRKMIHEMFHANRGDDLSALPLSQRGYSHLDMQQAAWDVAQARGLTNYVSAGVAVFSGKRPTVDDGGAIMFGELIYKYCKTWERP